SVVRRYCAVLGLTSFPTRRSSDLIPLGECGLLILLQAGRVGAFDSGILDYAFRLCRSRRTLAGRRVGTAREQTHRTIVGGSRLRSEEHTSELQSQSNLVCRLLLEK